MPSIALFHWKALVPLIADLVYLAGLIGSVFSNSAALLVLVGLVGIGVNVAKSYRLFVSDRGYVPLWWFLPTLFLPWTSLYISAQKDGDDGVSQEGTKGHFRLSTTMLGVVLAALLVASSFVGPVNKYADRMLAPLDKPGQTYLLETSKQVGIAFASARLLNGMLSLIEEMELSAELGVGGTVSPGEVLEPLDDLAERFSVVMLVNLATVSGILLLGEMGKLIGLALLVPLGILVLAASLWTVPDKRSAVARTGYKIVLLGLFLRLFVPAIGMGSMALDRLILDKKQAEAVEKMPEFVRQKAKSQELAERMEEDATEGREMERGNRQEFFYGILGMGAEIKNKMGEIKKDMVKLKDTLPQIIDSMVQQIVIFVVKSIVLPLVFLLILLRVYRWIAESPRAGSDMEGKLKEILSRERQNKGEAASGPSQFH
ncbi:MAG: hypothetical protein K9K39_06295 [Desulfohalobiaceae bacterium]|nr:hypothetical protein [Desulfohalobiaceae bacterium]